VNGQLVLAQYESTQTLDHSLRCDLVTCIVEEYYNKSLAMSTKEFETMAYKIVDLFPNENVDIYFMPANTSQKKVMGKLSDKYGNFTRKIKAIMNRARNSIQNADQNIKYNA
jgi:hypothetical protein